MSKNVTELWGREFSIVKNGLSEAEVVSFVNKLISERDTLIKRQEHLSSLVQLAERTVAEADNIAKQVKEEAIEQSKAEADTIVAQAKEQAQQIIEERRAEAVAIAEKEAEAIKATAEHEVELLLEEKVKGIQSELRSTAQRLCTELLSQLESLKQQVTASETEFEHKLSQPTEETSTVTMEEDERHDKLLELIQAIDRTDTDEPEWELEILPPIDTMKMMGIVTHLDSLPEVEKTEIIPRTDKPSIIVFLREPIHLTDVLKTLPEVAQVKEDATDTAGANGKPRKVQIVLAGETAPEEVS